jgi:hypothetical protein
VTTAGHALGRAAVPVDAADEPSVEDCLAQVHPEDREAVAAAVDRSVATGTGHAIECRVVRPDGTAARST